VRYYVPSVPSQLDIPVAMHSAHVDAICCNKAKQDSAYPNRTK
jgi:hypothetical protein